MTTARLVTLIVMVFALFLPFSTEAAPLFTLADLNGGWQMNRLGSPGPWWARGLYNISSGIFTNC